MTTAHVYSLPTDAKTRDRLMLMASYLLELTGQAPDDKPTTWIAPLRWEPLDVDPTDEADALVGNVFKFLSERYGVKGHRGHALTFEKMPLKSMAAYAASDSELSTKLGLVYYEKSLYAFVLGAQGMPEEANTLPWFEALAFAEREKLIGAPSHEWFSVIGSTGTNNAQTPTFPEGELIIGELTLQSCTFSYEERRPLSSLSSWSQYRWVPLLLKGRSRGHHWQSAEFDALRQVHRLCGLLTVESGVHWSLKESPRPIEWGPIHLPDQTPLGLVKCDGADNATDSPTLAAPPIDCTRLVRMWQRCLKDESLGAPVEAYYQAASLRDSHPSFALVGFVAAIEEVGKRMIEAPSTERCPTCNKERTSSSAERFRAALRLVLPEEKIQDVSRDLYRWRSGTAHAGRTYAWESSFGRPLMGDSLLVSPPQSTFSVRGPMRAEELARDLLFVLLGGKQAITSINSIAQ